MGIDIIRLSNQPESTPNLVVKDLAVETFATHQVSNPLMSIWLMNTAAGKPVLPWWRYESRVDEDILKINNLWGVSSAQGLFDCLFFAQLKKVFNSGLYVIFPGNIRTDGWDKLKDPVKAAFSRGQGCQYRLEGAYNSKLSINWVPFYQPQSVVKDPSLESFWRLFSAARSEDPSNSIGFFQLSDTRKLPTVLNLLLEHNDKRSETLSTLVDWFGLYSSPVQEEFGSCAVSYAHSATPLPTFATLQNQFQSIIEVARISLIAAPTPSTVLRLLSRFVPL